MQVFYERFHFIAAIGCDGTPVNTGPSGGIIRKMEEKLGRPLQWLICTIHGNELPLRNLLKNYEGPTTGPLGYSGPISKAVVECEKLKVVKFKPLKAEIDLPKINSRELSKDQNYLYEISKSVAEGHCSEDLEKRYPGNISHARWLTWANRILRLYIATPKPTKNLNNLVELIIKVYVPVWFAIRKEPECYNGARHVWLSISLSRSLDPKVKKVIDPIIERNAYFAHPENLLLAMMTDDQLEIRVKAMDKILECRKANNEKLREFKPPKLNFEAEDYTSMIEWDQVSEPPLIKNIETKELCELIMNNTVKLKQLLEYPCHTQAVERHIKIVTEASKSVIGHEARHNRIRGVLKSRSLMPKFQTKKDYVLSEISNESLQ